MKTLLAKLGGILASGTLLSSVAFALVNDDDIFPGLEDIRADYLCQDEEGGGLAFSLDPEKAWVILSEDARQGLALENTEIQKKDCESCYQVREILAGDDGADAYVTLDMEESAGSGYQPATYSLESSEETLTVSLSCKEQGR